MIVFVFSSFLWQQLNPVYSSLFNSFICQRVVRAVKSTSMSGNVFISYWSDICRQETNTRSSQKSAVHIITFLSLNVSQLGVIECPDIWHNWPYKECYVFQGERGIPPHRQIERRLTAATFKRPFKGKIIIYTQMCISNILVFLEETTTTASVCVPSRSESLLRWKQRTY